LKLLNNSTNTDTNLLKEIALYKAFINETNNVVKCYGISQHPETKNYVIVMEYLRGDSLRKYLQNNYRELKFEDKLNQLSDIAQGLKDIHSQQNQNLVHGDFHSGNILYPPCRIIDLGLNEEGKGKVYGLMPYVAPEVLQSKPYTQASDIYSFGMIAYEIFSGLPPYHGSAYDISLSLQICRGTRPKFEIKIPELLKDLIERCWDDNPVNRPNIIKINELLER
jgi:serine/threonine protein kinase